MGGPRPPRPGSIQYNLMKGIACAASGGVATGAGSLLSSMGLTTVGSSVAATGASLTGMATTLAGSVPWAGGAMATSVATLSTAATCVVLTAPYVAAGYGLYKLGKWLKKNW